MKTAPLDVETALAMIDAMYALKVTQGISSKNASNAKITAPSVKLTNVPDVPTDTLLTS